MALIKCPECGKEISDKAPACIHCGFPLSLLHGEETSSIKIEDPSKKNKLSVISDKGTPALYSLEIIVFGKSFPSSSFPNSNHLCSIIRVQGVFASV